MYIKHYIRILLTTIRFIVFYLKDMLPIFILFNSKIIWLYFKNDLVTFYIEVHARYKYPTNNTIQNINLFLKKQAVLLESLEYQDLE